MSCLLSHITSLDTCTVELVKTKYHWIGADLMGRNSGKVTGTELSHVSSALVPTQQLIIQGMQVGSPGHIVVAIWCKRINVSLDEQPKKEM